MLPAVSLHFGVGVALAQDAAFLEQLPKDFYYLGEADFARLQVYVRPERTAASERWLLLRNDANCKIKDALSNAPQASATFPSWCRSGALWKRSTTFVG